LISPIERLAGGLSDGILVIITKVVKKNSSKKKRPHKNWLMSPSEQKKTTGFLPEGLIDHYLCVVYNQE